MWRAIKPYAQGLSIAIPIVLLCWAIASLIEYYDLEFPHHFRHCPDRDLGVIFKDPRGL